MHKKNHCWRLGIADIFNWRWKRPVCTTPEASPRPDLNAGAAERLGDSNNTSVNTRTSSTHAWYHHHLHPHVRLQQKRSFICRLNTKYNKESKEIRSASDPCRSRETRPFLNERLDLFEAAIRGKAIKQVFR